MSRRSAPGSPPDNSSCPASFAASRANFQEPLSPCRHPLESLSPRAPPPVSAPIPPVEIVVLRTWFRTPLGDLLPRRLLSICPQAQQQHLPQFIQRLLLDVGLPLRGVRCACNRPLLRRSPSADGTLAARLPAKFAPIRQLARLRQRQSPQSPADSSEAAIPAAAQSGRSFLQARRSKHRRADWAVPGQGL